MAEQQPASATLADKNYFLIRRLHSLTGLVPVGVFLCFHLAANATILVPSEEPGGMFQKAIEGIHALGWLVYPVEIVGIFIPLLFHALLGFQIIFTGRSNAQQYQYGPNIRYTLQRITGVLAFLFIFYHLWHLHWFGASFGGGAFVLHDEVTGAATGANTTASAIQTALWIAPLYALGIVSCVFHLANGVWTSLITWGITIKPQTQRTSAYVCTAFGIMLSLIGIGALSGFRTFDTGSVASPTGNAHATATDHAP